jgi:hypothetical protein
LQSRSERRRLSSGRALRIVHFRLPCETNHSSTSATVPRVNGATVSQPHL